MLSIRKMMSLFSTVLTEKGEKGQINVFVQKKHSSTINYLIFCLFIFLKLFS